MPHWRCCCCASPDACSFCGADNTPITFGVTIPAQTFATNDCRYCVVYDNSWQIVGTFAGEEFCLEQDPLNACRWVYDAAYSEVEVRYWDSADCSGDPCYVTERINVSAEYGTVLGTDYLFVQAYVYDPDGPGACASFPTTPGGQGVYLFQAIVPVTSLAANFCRDGGNVLSLDPAGIDDCGFAGSNDNPWIFTTQTTATMTPCCEVPL